MKISSRFTALALALPLLYIITACGGGGGGGGGGTDFNCSLTTNEGCDSGTQCAYTTQGGTDCYTPIIIKGMVFDLATQAPIEGARVVARDANGAPVSTIAVTDADGNYELSAAVTRDEEGNPVPGSSMTLRADAAGYQTFPGGVRQALPLDPLQAVVVTTSVAKDDQLVLQTALTDIALIALEAGAGTAQIFGSVELPETSVGALVVAEASATEGHTALTGSDGNYRIFNLPAGTYTVKGYAQGVNYDTGSATLADGDEAEVNLSLNEDASATLNGSVQIVNAPGGLVTSVILVVESTFNDSLARGETPPGLRAPSGGIAPNISGAFTIEGIPAGTYVILAAFENDFLVRDPDTCIAGTAIIHQTFANGDVIDLSEGFKITEALEVLSPGASGPEAVTDPNPTFSWVDDSSEDRYDITLLDTFGNTIWTKNILGVSGTNPSVTYDGPALDTGMYYQFKVVSSKDGCELSQTEDLKGVFYIE